MADPVLRNQQITQSYHEISWIFSQRTGPCANWCTFAIWASRQAGQTIRQEDLLKALENHLATAPELGQAIYELAEAALAKGAGMDKKRIAQLAWDIADPRAAMLRASAAVACGNQKVYVEIGREFARFLDSCGKDEHFDAASIARFSETLKPGNPPDLQTLTNPDLVALLNKIDPSPDSVKDTAAIDWANLEDRLHFIADLFRCYQKTADLLLPE